MPKSKVNIFGQASKKTILRTKISNQESEMSTLEFLLQKKIPIAWSCHGEGVCKKCIVNNSTLACLTPLKNIESINDEIMISIDYL